MIAVERPALAPPPAEAQEAPEPSGKQPSARARRRRAWAARVPSGGGRVAIVLPVALLAGTAGGGALLDGRTAFDVQSRAAAAHQNWAVMRADGIPDSELAILEQEWVYSQKVKFLGIGTEFWSPGASTIVDRWQSQAAAIYAADLVRYRARAVAADQGLHEALGVEPFVQRKARLDALSVATRPDELAALGADWSVETKLVPIDTNIASAAGAVANQGLQAQNLGIRSDPGPALMTRAGDYATLGALERMARAEFLTRTMISTRKNLQDRLDAAGDAHEGFCPAGGAYYPARLPVDRPPGPPVLAHGTPSASA